MFGLLPMLYHITVPIREKNERTVTNEGTS